PAATTRTVPWGPTTWSRTLGGRDASARVSSATRKHASLWSRVFPRSVFRRTSMRTGLGARRNIGLGLTHSLHDLAARAQGGIERQALGFPPERERAVVLAAVGLSDQARRERAVLLAHAGRIVDQLCRVEDHRRRPVDQRVEDGTRLRGIDRRRAGPDARAPRLAPGWPACRAGAAGVRTPARRIGPDARGHLARPLATSPKHGHRGPAAPQYHHPPDHRRRDRAPPHPLRPPPCPHPPTPP